MRPAIVNVCRAFMDETRRLRISHYNQPDATAGAQSVIILGNKDEYLKARNNYCRHERRVGGRGECACDGLKVDHNYNYQAKENMTVGVRFDPRMRVISTDALTLRQLTFLLIVATT